MFGKTENFSKGTTNPIAGKSSTPNNDRFDGRSATNRIFNAEPRLGYASVASIVNTEKINEKIIDKNDYEFHEYLEAQKAFNEGKISEFYGKLEENNIKILNKAPIRTFLLNFPESIDNVKIIADNLRNKFNLEYEIIFHADEENNKYLNFCIRPANYDENFYQIISEFQKGVSELLRKNTEIFNILIYTDYKKINSTVNDQ